MAFWIGTRFDWYFDLWYGTEHQCICLWLTSRVVLAISSVYGQIAALCLFSSRWCHGGWYGAESMDLYKLLQNITKSPSIFPMRTHKSGMMGISMHTIENKSKERQKNIDRYP